MNEDDTFRVLKRTPYDDMSVIIRAHTDVKDYSWRELCEKLLPKYGWTFEDFKNETIRRNKEYMANLVEELSNHMTNTLDKAVDRK